MSFWRSEAGRLALDRFDSWAAIERLRENGGLALATGSGAGGQGGAYGRWGISDSALKAADVDATLKEWNSESLEIRRWLGMDRLLRFIYVDGTEQVLTSVTFTLYGGEKVTMDTAEIDEKGEPARYLGRDDQFRMERVFDLANFEDPLIDKAIHWFLPVVIGPLGIRRRIFLSQIHEQFAVSMIALRGIGVQAPTSRLARARRSEMAVEQPPVSSYVEPTDRDSKWYADYMAGSVGVSAHESDSENLRGASQKIADAIESNEF